MPERARPDFPDMMTTSEVARYLRIKERKVYDLVAKRAIPCTRVTGKWLFPRTLVDRWLLGELAGNRDDVTPHTGAAWEGDGVFEAAGILAGSHDPLLEWAVRQSGSDLALAFDGSLRGLERLCERRAGLCGMHAIDPETGDYNVPYIKRFAPEASLVAIEWTRRTQGLIVAKGNPLRLERVADLVRARIIPRQEGAGSRLLLHHLLREAGLAPDELSLVTPPARSETEVALAVAEGKADAGLAIACVARQVGLDFVPLFEERYDLVLWRRVYFEAPMQRLLAFCRSGIFLNRAKELPGYDIGGLGTVRYNGP